MSNAGFLDFGDVSLPVLAFSVDRELLARDGLRP